MIEKIVTTVSGESLPISKTRIFEGKYYKIGDPEIENSGDCYKINDKYYRVEKGNIVYCNTFKKYTLKNANLLSGLIENDKIGWFQRSNHVMYFENKHGIVIPAMNENILIQNKKYREELSSGLYFHISRKKANAFIEIKKPSSEYKTSLPYDSKGRLDSHIQRYNSKYEFEVLHGSNEVGEALKDYTFGLEFETIKGYIPQRITDKLGLIPLRDGSISGIEYVTIPLQGVKGVQTLFDTTKALKERTEFDNSCALHMHIGNVPRTKEFILAFFKLTTFIQDDIFELFPLYKKYNFNIKNKNYSKPYPTYSLISKMDPVITSKNIDYNFNVLFSYLSGGVSFYDFNNDLNNVTHHPNDPSGNQKWNIKHRYFIHNLIPLIFGNKTTIEFRIHTPTYDMSKISMFLLLSTILVDYAKINTKNILEGNALNCSENQNRLMYIIKDYCNRNNISYRYSIYDRLVNYILTRQENTCHFSKLKGVLFDEEDYGNHSYFDWYSKISEISTTTSVEDLISDYLSNPFI